MHLLRIFSSGQLANIAWLRPARPGGLSNTNNFGVAIPLAPTWVSAEQC